MKKTFLFFILTTVCYVLSHLFVEHKGYVLIAWGPYTLESNLWSFLFGLMIGVCILMLILSFFKLIFNSISLFYPITRSAKSKKALARATRGMIHYVNGHWLPAHRLLDQSADAGQAPLITYLAAARAAHQSGNYDASANCLRKADKAAPSAELAIGITHAELLLERGQNEQALAILKRLYKKSPRHTYVLKLLKQNYYQLKDWNALVKLLPTLKKRKVIDAKEYLKLKYHIYNALFHQAYLTGKDKKTAKERTAPLVTIWGLLNNQHKKNELLIYEYASVMVKLGAEHEAECFIRQQLPQRYTQKLVQLYGDLNQCDPQKQLSNAEFFLTQHPHDPILMLTLAKICTRCKLYGKAHEYFKRCLAISPSTAACNGMGQLFAKQGLYKQSAHYFMQGFKQSNKLYTESPESITGREERYLSHNMR